MAKGPGKWKDFYGENKSCHLVTLEWFFIQILVNFEIFKLSQNISLKHYLPQISFSFIYLFIYGRQFEPLNG